MALEIDNYLLKMGFDNSEFERGASQSLGTLGKLKQALELKGAEAGFENLTAAAKRVSFDALTNGLDTVGRGFTAMEAIAFGALSRIGSKVADLGMNLFQQLFAQSKVGWGKYNEMTKSVQTIIAATGKSIEEVTGYTDRLNWFTDETSFNLTDMTNNISKFTSAGIDLSKATVQMMGIGNASALAGSSIENASHAMMGFSKAMAAGYMSRLQWNWIETAHMDTMEFKQTLIDAGVEAGKLVRVNGQLYAQGVKRTEENIVNAERMRETLSDKWLTKEVMEKALQVYGGFANELGDLYDMLGSGKFYTTNELLNFIDEYHKGALDINKMSKLTGVSVESLTNEFEKLNKSAFKSTNNASDMTYTLGRRAFAAAQEAITLKQAWDALADAVSTGWMRTFQLIFGNYEEAKKLWTQLANWLYDLFAEGGNIRNELLSEWHLSDTGGYKDFIQGIYNMMDAVTSFRDTIKTILSDFSISWEDLLSVTNLTSVVSKFNSFSSSLSESLSKVQKFLTIFRGKNGYGAEETEETADTASYLSEIVRSVNKYSIPNQKFTADDYLKLSSGMELFEGTPKEVVNKFSDKSSNIPIITQAYKDQLPVIKKLIPLTRTLAEYNKSTRDYYDNLYNNPRVTRKIFDVADRSLGAHTIDQARESTELIKAGEEGAETFARAQNRLKSVYDLLTGIKDISRVIREVFEGAWNSIKEAFAPVTTLGDNFLSLFGAIGRRLSKISEDYFGTDKITEFFTNLSDNTKGPIERIVEYIGLFIDGIAALIDPEVSDGTNKFATAMEKAFSGLFDGLRNAFARAFPILSAAGSMIKDIFVGVFGTVGNFFKDLNVSNFDIKGKQIGGVIATLLQVFAAGHLHNLIKSLHEGTQNGGLWGLLSSVIFGTGNNGKSTLLDMDDDEGPLDKISNSFVRFTEKISGAVSKFFDAKLLKDFANSMLKLAGALLILAMIPPTDLNRSLAVIAGLVVGIIAVFKAISHADFGDIASVTAAGTALAGLGTGVLALAGALFVLSLINTDKMDSALHGLTVVLIEMTAVLAILGRMSAKSLLAAAAAMFIMAPAMVMFSASLIALSLIKQENLSKALEAFGELLLSVGLVLGTLSALTLIINPGSMIAAAAAFLLLAPAMAILATSLGIIALIPADKLQGTLDAFASVITGMTLVATVLGFLTSVLSPVNMLAAAGAFLVLAPAILIMAGAFGVLGLLLANDNAQSGLVAGMNAMGSALMALTIAAVALQMTGAIAALLALAASFVAIGAGGLMLGAGIAVAALGIAGAIAIVTGSIGGMLVKLSGAFEWVGEKMSGFWAKLKGDSFEAGERVKENMAKNFADIIPESSQAGTDIAGAFGDAFNGTAIESINSEEIMAMVSQYLGEDASVLGLTGYDIGNLFSSNLEGGMLSYDFSAILDQIKAAIVNKTTALGVSGEKAGIVIGGAIEKGTKNILKVKSPSRVFMEIMDYVAAGIERGADNNLTAISEVGASIGETLYSSTENAMGDYTGMSPTLTPVIDMTNARPGNLSFGATLTPSAVRNLAAVSADIQDQRGSMNNYIDQAVQSAISGMKDQLTFVVPLEVDGRQFAQSTAKFTRSELNLMDRNTLRKGGYA